MAELTMNLKFSKPKRLKKQSKTALLRKADTLFSLKTRSRGVCELAGKDNVTCAGNLQTMHIVGRANRRLRWDDENVLCGCSGHHMYYTHHPTEFAMFIERHFPRKWLYIHVHVNEIAQTDYNALIKRLEEV